jgi:hypothetical protein
LSTRIVAVPENILPFPEAGNIDDPFHVRILLEAWLS